MICEDKKSSPPILTVMLTYNDLTVKNAKELFRSCLSSSAKMWGMKERGIPFEDMRELFSLMRECGKVTVLEVPAYSEKECRDGASVAAKCGCDYLMGTVYYDSVNEICHEYGIKYMPYVGNVSGRPSVLTGNCWDMI